MNGIDISSALPIPGWMTDPELTWLATQAQRSRCIAEIGSWRGRSTRAMADNLHPEGVIFTIDPFVDDSIGFPGWWTANESPDKYKQKDWLWSEFSSNLRDAIGTKIIPVRMFSANAYERFVGRGQKFDFVFIDGSHDYGHVTGDIQMFRQLLKPGGLLSGHDYNEPTCPEVAPAVNAQLGRVTSVAGTTIWYAA